MKEKTAVWELLYLLRCALDGRAPERSRVEAMDLRGVYRLARAHSLAAAVWEALSDMEDYPGFLTGRTPEERSLLASWREDRDRSVWRNTLMDAERAALTAWMDREGIWYMPLKGIRLQKLYPRPGMREMSDNDILFDSAFQAPVRDWFLSRGYTAVRSGGGVHDVYQKPPLYHFEMHRRLFSLSFDPRISDYYRDVKECLLPDGTGAGLRFRDEDHLVYLLAHGVKHDRRGGVGLRLLCDLYLFDRARGGEMDWTYVRRELEALGIRDWGESVLSLSRKLLSGEADLDPEEEALLCGHVQSGTYGTVDRWVENALRTLSPGAAVPSGRTKGRYLLRRVFPGRAEMDDWCSYYFPAALRSRALRPLAYVLRILRGLSHNREWKRAELRALFRKK